MNKRLSRARTENSEPGQALKYALRLLGYRDRSAVEMRQKLAEKGFSREDVDDTLARLEEKGYVNDRKLAELLKRDAIERRHFGPHGVRRLLLKKGIPPEVINSVAGEDEDYAGAARRLVEKKLRLMGDCSEDTAKRRLWGLLSRRGFAPDEIRQVLRNYFAF